MILPKPESLAYMVNERDITVSLEEFGLSKYEANAYVTLICRGTISASELAYYSELPRTKVYPVLLKLEKKKLAIISKSKPIMCTAIAAEDAFDGIIQEQINKVNAMNTLVTDLKRICEDRKKSRGAEEKRYFHLAANNVLNQLKTMLEGARSSIRIMVDPWGLNLLAECKEQLVAVLRKDVDVQVICNPAQIGTESFKSIPEGEKIRIADVVQNCFIFDETELLLIDSNSGKGAIFSSTEVLGVNQTKVFSHVWKNALKIHSLYDMTKAEAQEIYRIINLINENGLVHMLDSALESKSDNTDMLKLLEKNGINLKLKTLEEVVEIIDSTLQITCGGHVDYDTTSKNITIESKMNSGHSLPWAVILESYLQKKGYKPKMIYQNNSAKGEKVHIKINAK